MASPRLAGGVASGKVIWRKQGRVRRGHRQEPGQGGAHRYIPRLSQRPGFGFLCANGNVLVTSEVRTWLTVDCQVQVWRRFRFDP
jgi:hypothetical protein